MTTGISWQQRVGNQRDWVWRGWQTRYTYLYPPQPTDALPLLLLHGFGASIGHWRHNLEVWGQQHPVYAIDLLGFGASEKAATTYTVALWAEQIYDFWRTFIRRPLVLVGNSNGSLVSLAVAQAYPQMVAGIVMISLPDLAVEEEATPPLLRPLVAKVKDWVLSPWLLRSLFPIVRQPNFIRRWAGLAYATPEAITDELLEILAGPPQDRGSARAFHAVFRAVTDGRTAPRVREILTHLQIPLLLLWGQEDRMIPRQFIRPEHYLQYNSRLTLIELERVGHCPHDEVPDRVNALILDWLHSWQNQAIATEPPILSV